MEHIFADMLELFFFKLALYVTTTIKILCMHTIMHVNSIHIHMETISTKLTIFNMSRVKSLKT